MVGLSHLLQTLSPKKVLVAGDLMLDQYIFGSVERISPEAPVPIVHVEKEQSQAGGAGNVVLNLLALGAEVKVLGRVGDDPEGALIIQHLKKARADTEAIRKERNYQTTTKSRVIAERQQLVRLDREKIVDLSIEEEDFFIRHIPDFLQDVDLVAISDYQKGFLSEKFLSALLEQARKQKIPTLVDPKGKNFQKYQHATLVKPNLKEAFLAANLSSKTSSLDTVANILLKKMNIQHLLVTKSNEGMSLFSSGGIKKDFGVEKKEVVDVTGAGDTVLAILSLVLANNIDALEDGIMLANMAAQISIEHVGCYAVSVRDLVEKILEEFPENKIVETDDFFALKTFFKNPEHFHLLCLQHHQVATPSTFLALKELSSRKIVVYIEQKKFSNTCEEIKFLASLKEVSVILTQKEIFEKFLKVFPQDIFFELASNGELLEKQFSFSL